jgi:hypothetical protein
MTRQAWHLAEPPLLALAQPVLARCDPSPTALLNWLRPWIDDSLLEVIARAPFGVGTAKYLAHLRCLRDDSSADLDPKHFNQALDVLQLGRWWDPDSAGEEVRGARGHLLRAFCCAILLGAAPQLNLPNRDFVVGENQTIIQLVASALALGHEACATSLRLLAWRAERPTDQDEEYPFLALGVLLLAATVNPGADDAPWLRQLADWVVAIEAVAFCRAELRDRRQPWLWVENPAWLLGLTRFDGQHPAWRAVAWSVLVEQPSGSADAAAAALHAIAGRLI